MLVESVNNFLINKIPRKIEKELGYLRDEEESITKCGFLIIQNGTADETVGSLAQGLDRLKQRWIEHVDKCKPINAIIKEKELQLQECATLLDRLRDLVLNPPHPSFEETKTIVFSEKKEDVSPFLSEKERCQAIDNALKKLEEVPKERDLWVTQGSNSLSMCKCESSKQARATDEKKFLTALIERYPPHPSFELCLMSLGSGELMQDWLLLQQLVKVGYSSINLHLIDSCTTERHVAALKVLISKHLKAPITIVHTDENLAYDAIKVCRPFHAVMAFDFDSILHYPDSEMAWEAMIVATECLRENGLLFCSAFLSNYWFDARNKQWNLPNREPVDLSELSKGNQENPLIVGVTDAKYFWHHTFYYLAQLATLRRDIVVKVIKPVADNSNETLSETISIAKRILVPHNEVNLAMEFSDVTEDLLYDFFYVSNYLIDEPFLNNYLPKIREKGIVILNPHSCYQREQDYDKKAMLIKEVHRTIKSVQDVAKTLSQARSLQLNM